jgi:hypothetical protein
MKTTMTAPKGTTHVRLTTPDGKTALKTIKEAPASFDGVEGTLAFLKKESNGRFTELGGDAPAPDAKLKSIDKKTAALVAICHDQKGNTYQRVLAHTTDAALRAVGTKFPEGVWSVEKVDDSPDAAKVVDIDATKTAKVEKVKQVKALAEVNGKPLDIPTPSEAKKVVAAVDAGKKTTTATRSANYVPVDAYMVDLLKANQKSTGSAKTLDELAKDVHEKYPRNTVEKAAYWLKLYARKNNIEMSFDTSATPAPVAA